jgi:hypothetical protein
MYTKNVILKLSNGGTCEAISFAKGWGEPLSRIIRAHNRADRKVPK